MTNTIRHPLSLGTLALALLINSSASAALVTGFTLEATGSAAPGKSFLRSFETSGAITSGPLDVGTGVLGLSAGPGDSLYAFANSGVNSGLIRIDPATGQTTALGSSVFLQSIDYNRLNSTLYGIGGAAGAAKNLYSFDLASGNANFIASLTGLSGTVNQQKLAIRSDGVAYVTSLSGSTVTYGTLSLATAQFQNLGTTSGFGDLAFDPNDDLYQLNAGTLFSINQSTFEKTFVSSLAGEAGLAFTATSIPEPSSMALLFASTVLLPFTGLLRREGRHTQLKRRG